MTKTLAVCQYFNPVLHGECEANEPNSPYGHYLALHIYDKNYDGSPYNFLDFWTPCDYEERILLNQQTDNACRTIINKLSNHSNHSNDANDVNYNDYYYDNNITSIRELQNFPKVDIVEIITLNSGHSVAIKKTAWLSIFQRMLKNRYNKNKTNKTNKTDKTDNNDNNDKIIENPRKKMRY